LAARQHEQTGNHLGQLRMRNDLDLKERFTGREP
jgi:hypothetical protein